MVIVGREATCTGCTANRGHAYTLFSSSLVLHILPLVPTILLSFVFPSLLSTESTRVKFLVCPECLGRPGEEPLFDSPE